jgi:2-deoxy-D-gluconate 3-dehydrogenase
MKAVVHRGARTLDIESRVAEAPAPAKEWDGGGVNVNTVAPGHVATDTTEALRADPQHDQAILGRGPACRWRGPDDLAGATVLLASSAPDHVNGIVLPVDGGWPGR